MVFPGRSKAPAEADLKSLQTNGGMAPLADPRLEENFTHSQRATRDWLWAGLLLAIVFLICNLPIVIGTGAPQWDASELFAPNFTLIADHARAGRIVLWDPWVSGGVPDYAEPELGVTSPVAIFVGAITGGTEWGFRAYWLLIWFLGPLGLLLLARHWRAPPWAGFVVALGFAFCGFYTGQAQHTSSVYSISLLPWVLWRLDLALQSRALRPAFEAGALWGLSALGGYPAQLIMSGGFLFLWILGRCCCSPEEPSLSPAISSARGARARLPFGLAAGALVLSVALPILAPSYLAFFLEGGNGYSDRGASTTALRGMGVRTRDDSIADGLLQVGALSTFASPYLTTLKFGGDNPTLWPRTDISLTNIYLGASISILGLLAILNRPGSGWRWWLIAAGLFFLACALGNQLPVRGWLYDYCPPTRYFRNTAMFRTYAMLCVIALALLAGKDLQAAIKNPQARIWKLFPAAALFLAACAAASYYFVLYRVHTRNVENRLWVANIGLAGVWLGSLAIAAWLRFRPQSRRRLPVLLGMLAIADAGLTSYLASPTVYSTNLERQVWTRIEKSRRSSLDLTPEGLQRDARPPGWVGGACPVWWTVCTGPDTNGIAKSNQNVLLRMATLFNYATMTNRFLVDFERRPMLTDMATGSERTWFSTEAAVAAPTDAFYDAFVKRSEALGAPVLVTHPPAEMAGILKRGLKTKGARPVMDAIGQLPAAQRVATRVIRYVPNGLDLEADCPRDGWLLVTDRWARGWRARVNGQPAAVFGGDFIFRAVRVRAGENRIQFDYRPAGWPILLVLSWGVLALVFVGPHLAPKRLFPRST